MSVKVQVKATAIELLCTYGAVTMAALAGIVGLRWTPLGFLLIFPALMFFRVGHHNPWMRAAELEAEAIRTGGVPK